MAEQSLSRQRVVKLGILVVAGPQLDLGSIATESPHGWPHSREFRESGQATFPRAAWTWRQPGAANGTATMSEGCFRERSAIEQTGPAEVCCCFDLNDIWIAGHTELAPNSTFAAWNLQI